MNEEQSKEIIETARAFLVNAGLGTATIKRLEEVGYFDAPAAQKHHLNRPHGLCEHSVNVTRLLLHYGVFGEDKVSAYRVGMLHDLVKCWNYAPIEHLDGKVTYSWRNAPYPGHGVASALLCASLNICLTDAERSAIVWHMGAFKMTDEQLEEYRGAVLAHPTAILGTHFCDHLASVRETLDEMAAKRKAKEEGKDE